MEVSTDTSLDLGYPNLTGVEPGAILSWGYHRQWVITVDLFPDSPVPDATWINSTY